MSIWLQKSAFIQPRTSPLKFANLAEKSEKDSVSNLFTKVLDKLRSASAEEMASIMRALSRVAAQGEAQATRLGERLARFPALR